MRKTAWWIFLAGLGLVILTACAGQAEQQPQSAPSTFTAVWMATATGAAEIPVTSTEGAPTVTPQVPAAVTLLAADLPPVDCTSPAALTPAMTEGPYFTPGSPETKDLAGDLPGKKLRLSGYVLTADCHPVPNTKIDFWQTDAQGRYDNTGYRLRGHQFTDAKGRYELLTVVPGEYPGRTAHIHIKVQAPSGPELTTQLFLPGVAQNQQDRIFDENLLVQVLEDNGETVAAFDFVVEE